MHGGQARGLALQDLNSCVLFPAGCRKNRRGERTQLRATAPGAGPFGEVVSFGMRNLHEIDDYVHQGVGAFPPGRADDFP